VLRERLEQARGDARRAADVVASGTSAYLASYRITMLIMAVLIAALAADCFWILRRGARGGRQKANSG
jgi:hypothetical protein